jgi:hypothetical protein
MLAGCTNTAATTSTTTSRVATTAVPSTASAPTRLDRLDTAYLDGEAADRAYWQRIVDRLGEQDDVVLDTSGDISIGIVHEGDRVTLYRDDLASIAYNSCLGVAKGDGAAATVGWIKDAFGLQRRWEAGGIRLAAIEAKCPTLA